MPVTHEPHENFWSSSLIQTLDPLSAKIAFFDTFWVSSSPCSLLPGPGLWKPYNMNSRNPEPSPWNELFLPGWVHHLTFPFDRSQNKITPSSSPKVLPSRGWMLYWFYLVSIMITYGLIRTNAYRFRKLLLFDLMQDCTVVQCSWNTEDDTAVSSVWASERRR